MPKLMEDAQNINNWKRCMRKARTYKMSVPGIDRIYVNSLDSSATVTSKRYPVLVKEDSNTYWTLSVSKMKREFCLLNGEEISDKFIEDMFNGRTLCVKPKKMLMWVFHADLEKYRYDCPFGVNKSGKNLGKGDYIICYGNKTPSISTLRVVNEAVFNKQYTIKEDKNATVI